MNPSSGNWPFQPQNPTFKPGLALIYLHKIRRSILFHDKRQVKETGEVEVEQLLKKMAVADAFGSLNTGKWGDRQGCLILVGGKCERLLKKNGRR